MGLDAITGEQRAALGKLASLLRDGFYLVGGVAIAARFSHRTSRDLDLFATRDPTSLQSDLDHLPGVTIAGRAAGTIHLKVDGVPVSLIEYRSHYCCRRRCTRTCLCRWRRSMTSRA
jgi:hypothetical protein